jgi:hypothetical protein
MLFPVCSRHALLSCIPEILGLKVEALWHCAELVSCGLQVQALLSNNVGIHVGSRVFNKVISLAQEGREKLQVGTARHLN